METQLMEIITAVVERGAAHALYQALYHSCQFPIEKVRKIFSEKSPEELTDDELRELTDRNQDAAWAMYVQMLTRITTQPLPDEDGDEQTALDSVYKLFEITRDILTEYGREAPEFSKLAVLILNQKVRWFTAKWHKRSIENAFEDPDACTEFREELKEVRVVLRGYMQALAALAGVEDITDISEE